MLSDLIVACRGLRRSPIFTVAAIVTLALGIGANTTMFSVVNAVLLRPLPGYQTGRLVRIQEASRPGHSYLPPDVYLRLLKTLQSFAPLAANQNCRMNLTGQGEAEQLLYRRVREQLAALPGVRAVATASSLPMFGVSIFMDVHPEGQPERRSEHPASLDVISDGYFGLMGMPLRSGRTFNPNDREGSTPVAIVSQSVAGRYFAGTPLGKRIILPEFKFNIDGENERHVEIVGIVGNVCATSLADCDAEHVYLPESQNALRMENLLIRTEGDPMTLVKAVRHEMFVEAPEVPLDDPRTLDQRTSYLMDGPRRAMWLLGLFAGLALLLAAVGIYSVSSYLATQRSREIGIRMALGAEFGDIARLIYRGILLPSALGLAVGIAAAFGLTRLLESLLFGVGPSDPKTLALSALALLAISGLAATSPALRAACTDPAKVLRRE